MKERPVEEIADKITDYLIRYGSCSCNDLVRHIGGRTNNIVKAKEFLIKKEIIKQERDIEDARRIKITLLRQKRMDISLRNIISSLPLAKKQVSELMGKIKKPLFVHVEVEDGETIPFKIKPRNKRILGDILQVVNDLANRSVALTFADATGIITKDHSNTVKQFHKKCIKTTKDITKTLEDEFQEPELRSYLYYNISGFKHLNLLEFLNQK